MLPRSHFVWLLVLAALLTTAGCAHYRLGTAGKLAFSRLYVEPVINNTLLPQSRALLATQIRTAFEKDGRVRLVNSPDAADATLKVVISDYRREVASVLSSDTGLARKFTLTLTLTCTLHDQVGQKDFFTARTIDVERDAFIDGGLVQSEYQTLPLLADLAAQKLTHAVLDVW